MKEILAGLLAPVDAGKTSLAEALLYQSGFLHQLGRVDKGNAFLDSNQLEKKRGITIFSHLARLKTDDLSLTLLDTPGHVDFAAQTEAALSVLDYGILLISARDGVTSYTRTLWHLLAKYQIPTFIFVNKMDEPNPGSAQILSALQHDLNKHCFSFMQENENWTENIAGSSDKALTEFLQKGKLAAQTVHHLIAQRLVFPVYFGSALKQEGITQFLSALAKWTETKRMKKESAVRVFKISHDERGERLTWLRVFGGNLPAKTMLLSNEKINEIRFYNGQKYKVVSKLEKGQVAAVTGLKSTYPGQGIGLKDAPGASLRPVMTYRVNLQNNSLATVLKALRTLADEDPLLNVQWSEHLQEIRIQVMGAVQLQILQQLLEQRFHLKVTFDQGSILYKETISAPIEAAGHFEPLRHYAEVHFLLEPGKRNTCLLFKANCSLEVLAKNWQHQIMNALASKEHLGVLIGAPITDMKITLIGGRTSQVHSVGGDFRQAVYRGIRQGLMELKKRGKCQLLEPWYSFRLEIPDEQVGRALTDIQKMSGQFTQPVTQNEITIIKGKAPVNELQGYDLKVRAYTHGQGHLECIFAGYQPCHNADQIIKKRAYDPVADLANTPNSVFCAHGAGHTVTWDKVPQVAQFPYQFPLK